MPDRGHEPPLRRVLVASGLSGGDNFADAAFRIACEKRHDVLAHPGPANIACDSIRVFRLGEQEDQDEMPVIDLRDLSRERARIDDKPHSFPRCLRGRVGERVAQVQVIDDDMHEATLSART
jgi:hypothetical protein